jgi:ribosome maturation factor RimP
MDLTERITGMAEPICRRAGVELVEVEYKPPTLRVTIDRQGGVDLEAIRDVTRALSNQLDREDPISGRYTLEVSSPGLERPLRTPAHFRRAVGSDVVLRLRHEVEGDHRVAGVVRAADDEAVEIADAERPEAHHRIRYDEIVKARTVFTWGPAPKPGQARRTRRPAVAGPTPTDPQPVEEP